MDDLSNELSALRPKTPVEEAWHNEQKRKQYDIIRVKNPTSKDFYVTYDTNQYQRVPANSTLDIPRYIAVRYVQHMKDNIINTMIQEKHDREVAERNMKGFPGFKSKWEENEETYSTSNYPRTNDQKLMTEIMGELWIGLVLEFGRDVPPNIVDPRSGEVDLTSPEMKILEGLDKRRVPAKNTLVSSYQATPSAPYIPQAGTKIEPLNAYQSGFSSMTEKLDAAEVIQE